MDDRHFDTKMRRLLFEAVDLLSQSKVRFNNTSYTFRQIYDIEIDQVFANTYLAQLLDLENVATQSPSLTAQFSKQITPKLEGSGLLVKGLSESYFLLAYCIYWWQNFARGYAFEIEIMRDLEISGVEFQMHNVLNPVERYSPADLIVLGLLGDIKTSTYFLQWQSDGPLTNDFYITRLYAKGQSKTLVVFQKPYAWQRIGGEEAILGTLNNALALLPKPVQIKKAELALTIVEYERWKEMVKHIQLDEGIE